ncbi:MAG: VOC family protein [Burkholderiaceae bacterium]
MQVRPYLFFDGRCEEAIAFYQEALGAEVTALMRFAESPDPCPEGMLPPGSENKVMHAQLRIGDIELMASDGNCGGQPNFQGISLSLLVSDVAEAERRFAALGAGGQVQMPMDRTFFAERFGMVADRFGVSWMVLTGPAQDPAA